MRMLAKEPERRPRSAAALARTLDAMLDHTPPDGVPLVGGPARHAWAGAVMSPTSDGLLTDRMVEEGLLAADRARSRRHAAPPTAVARRVPTMAPP